MRDRYDKDEIFGTPRISPEAFISSKASIVGEVIIEKLAMVAPGAWIRADECGPFYIGKGTNIQEGAILHGLLNMFVDVGGAYFSIWIGSHCSVAHGAKVHGPTKVGKKTFIGFDAIVHRSNVGRNCFIGFKASIQNATIGDDCYIATGAQVENVTLAAGRYVPNAAVIIDQQTADALGPVPFEIAERAHEFNKEVVDLNKQLVALYTARRKLRQNGKSFSRLVREIFTLIIDWLKH